VPDAIVEKLWRVVDCRDRSLARVHASLAKALTEKEGQIVEKEGEIRRLALVASERLELINSQHAELEAVRRSSEYRFGYLVLNPWQVLKKRLFGNTSFR
jgi:ribosomal protein L13